MSRWLTATTMIGQYASAGSTWQHWTQQAEIYDVPGWRVPAWPERASPERRSNTVTQVAGLNCYQGCRLNRAEPPGRRSQSTSSYRALDVVFRDDLARLRTDHGPANMAVVRHMAINLLRQATPSISLKNRRKRAAWNTDYLAQLIRQAA